MTQKYKLNYFPFTGRAEPMRYMFKLAGVEFTDNQIPFGEWPQQKPDRRLFPHGSMPTLEVEGQGVICTSKAVGKYVAEELGLGGSSNWDKAITDQVIETIGDLWEDALKIAFNSALDKETKLTQLKEYYTNQKCKTLLGFLMNTLKSKPDDKFFLGDKIMYVDLAFFNACDFLLATYPDMATDYPDLAAHHTAVANNEIIKKHIDERKHPNFSL